MEGGVKRQWDMWGGLGWGGKRQEKKLFLHAARQRCGHCSWWCGWPTFAWLPLGSLSSTLFLHHLSLFFSFNFSLAATLHPRIHDFFIVLRASQLCLLPLSPTSLLLTYLSSSFHHVSAPSDSTLPKGGESVGWLWTCIVEAHLSPAAPPTLQASHYSHSLCFPLNSSAQCSVIWCHSSTLCYDPILSLKKRGIRSS